MTTLQINRPGKPAWLREFKNRREAAKYGVAHYLNDNGYAPRKVAAVVASTYQDTGAATHGEITFEEIA